MIDPNRRKVLLAGRMDNLYDNSRLGNLMAIQGDMPVNAAVNNDLLIERGRHKQFSKTPSVDPYSSRYNNLIKLLQSDSPSSVLENIGPMAPLKLSMEEETVVLDGIPVEPSCGGSSLAYGHNRRPMYRVVEDNISIFPGSKSQAAAELEAPRCVSGQPSRPLKIHNPPSINVPIRDWLPLNEGIVVSSPSQQGKKPSHEDSDAYIHRFLDGPRNIRSFPIFTKIADP